MGGGEPAGLVLRPGSSQHLRAVVWIGWGVVNWLIYRGDPWAAAWLVFSAMGLARLAASLWWDQVVIGETHLIARQRLRTRRWAWVDVARIEPVTPRSLGCDIRLWSGGGRKAEVDLWSSAWFGVDRRPALATIVERATTAGAAVGPPAPSARVLRRQRHNVPAATPGGPQHER